MLDLTCIFLKNPHNPDKIRLGAVHCVFLNNQTRQESHHAASHLILQICCLCHLSDQTQPHWGLCQTPGPRIWIICNSSKMLQHPYALQYSVTYIHPYIHTYIHTFRLSTFPQPCNTCASYLNQVFAGHFYTKCLPGIRTLCTFLLLLFYWLIFNGVKNSKPYRK